MPGSLLTPVATSLAPRQLTIAPLDNGEVFFGLSKTQNIRFDHDGNGFAEQTGWVASSDGLFVTESIDDIRSAANDEKGRMAAWESITEC